ncbi:MAG: cytochrome c [Ignavibacteriaceae bacterium]|nr:cytochrome c [Ignavibacteriaceae bacterium]
MEELKKIISDFIKNLKENPGTIFGFLYPYILTIIVIIGLYYVANIGDIAINKTSAFVPDTTVIADLPVVQARTVPPVDIFKMKDPTDELIQKGKELYTTNCASCHNETGAGGGPAAVGMNPAPRNFTSPDGWKNGKTLSAIYTTLEEGIEGSSMISYNFLTPADRISIAHYIRKEFMPNPPVDTDDDLSALNSLYNLSAGMELPAQIPVSTAMEILSLENAQKTIRLEDALKTIDSNRSIYSVSLFKSIVDNEKLALSSMINSDTWRSGETAFTDFVTVNIGQNGFSPKVNYLSDADRNLLFSYLKQIL